MRTPLEVDRDAKLLRLQARRDLAEAVCEAAGRVRAVLRDFSDEPFDEALSAMIDAHDAWLAAKEKDRELAMRVGTAQSVICRLENADYAGHSLLMLHRIAEAVGKRVYVEIR